MWHAKFLCIVPCSILIIDLCAFSLLAQTIPDNTLGRESSTVNFDVTINNNITDLIEGGAIRDNNLFHSFSEFNIGNDSAIYFANPNNITNILTRITGNNTSEILGTLGVNGTANLFLLNPNGIVFGDNATLDVNGSFLATTADSYIFENGFAYSSSNPEIPPLLTVNIPHGLQFGSKAESIINRSQTLDESDFFAGLQVTPDSNITLPGGDVIFEHGHLNAPKGGSVSINANTFKAQGEFTGGSITANSSGNLVISKKSTIIANAIQVNGGDRPLEFGRLPEKITDATQKITITCSVGANQFAIAGKGGVPENPGQNLRGTTVWQDLRLSLIREHDVDRTSSNNHFSNSILVEANSWQMTPQGKVKLMAHNRNQSSFRPNQFNCHELASS